MTPETIVQKLARSVAKTPEDRVFARWYNDRGKVENTRTFRGIWTGSGEVSLTHVYRGRGWNRGRELVETTPCPAACKQEKLGGSLSSRGR